MKQKSISDYIRENLIRLVALCCFVMMVCIVHDTCMPPHYHSEKVYLPIEKGDTLWEIAEVAFTMQDRYLVFDEFYTHFREETGFTSGRDPIQAGDILSFTLEKRTEERWCVLLVQKIGGKK